MKGEEMHPFIAVAGGKTVFAARVGITERYVDMLLNGERQMSKRLDELIRLKIVLPATVD
jgi:hypothetical protein